jgi:NRAMP (natural resistance-associated macrophage protein)-like metal ion transporter
MALLALAGPGIISASAGNDAGGIATYASAGSQFAYRTIFFMVIVTFAYVAVQEMTARLAVYTGKGLAALIREQFALRWTAVAMICFAIANVGLVVTEFAGIGAAFELFGVSRYVAVPIAAVAIWMLVVLGSYRYAERVFLLLTVAFVTYPLAMVLGHPHWATVGSNLVLPRRRPHRDDDHSVHPTLRGERPRGSWGWTGRLSPSASRRHWRRCRVGRRFHVHNRRHGRRHRWHGSAAIRRRSGKGPPSNRRQRG